MGLGDSRNQLTWSASLLLSACACFVLGGKALVSLPGTGADLHRLSFEAATTLVPTLPCAEVQAAVRESGTRHALICFVPPPPSLDDFLNSICLGKGVRGVSCLAVLESLPEDNTPLIPTNTPRFPQRWSPAAPSRVLLFPHTRELLVALPAQGDS